MSVQRYEITLNPDEWIALQIALKVRIIKLRKQGDYLRETRPDGWTQTNAQVKNDIISLERIMEGFRMPFL